MLFKNHNDLLEEFTYFLPDATPPALQSAPVKKITARARGQAARGEEAELGSKEAPVHFSVATLLLKLCAMGIYHVEKDDEQQS